MKLILKNKVEYIITNVSEDATNCRLTILLKEGIAVDMDKLKVDFADSNIDPIIIIRGEDKDIKSTITGYAKIESIHREINDLGDNIRINLSR